MKLDMHCHTREGSPDGKTNLLDNIAILKEKGFDGMLIADHNSYKAYRYYKKLENKPENFTVLCGIEYDTLDAGHMLIIMPTGLCPRIMELRGMPVMFLVEVVHRLGGIIGPAHPCGEKFLSFCSTRRGRLLQDKLLKKFDFLEVYNACEENEANEAARKLALTYGLPGFGGSDSHKEDCIGLGFTELEETVHNESEFIRYIKNGLPVCADGTHYFHTTKQKLGRANDILVYSFWFYNKFLALFRSKARKLELLRSYDLRSGGRFGVKYITLTNNEPEK
ncbi:MAG: PHP domain-containing protein [Roseburia sp.]|nr:PHP domain-containing protein [Ruminococcus sp.]MCM1153814.1 PHP domain-containing protein [Roseburia sp.]MCM1243528.1 PHP domain-containing protein [Roseburia sp.]